MSHRQMTPEDWATANLYTYAKREWGEDRVAYDDCRDAVILVLDAIERAEHRAKLRAKPVAEAA